MLDLGPYAYDEISFEAAVERCLAALGAPLTTLRRSSRSSRSTCRRRLEGELFRITQEAVANAGRHGQAEPVTISLAADGRLVES